MVNKNSHELALFRFSLIAPVVNDTFDARSQMQYFRNVAAKTHIFPDGRSVKFFLLLLVFVYIILQQESPINRNVPLILIRQRIFNLILFESKLQ